MPVILPTEIPWLIPCSNGPDSFEHYFVVPPSTVPNYPSNPAWTFYGPKLGRWRLIFSRERYGGGAGLDMPFEVTVSHGWLAYRLAWAGGVWSDLTRGVATDRLEITSICGGDFGTNFGFYLPLKFRDPNSYYGFRVLVVARTIPFVP